MFIKRFHITDGATTTAGGVVRASTKHSRINGAAMAVEGDPVDCPACGKQGVIKCVMPRLSDRLNGKEYALSDDLCICGCNPPPKLIAAQNFSCQSFIYADEDAAPEAGIQQAGGPTMAASPHVASKKVIVQRRIRFVDRDTGKPCSNKPYRLTLVGGRVVQGTTDSDGHSSLQDVDQMGWLGAV